MEEYLNILIHSLELLPPDMTIHRVTGDGPGKLLLAPLWSLDKRNVLNTLHRTMRERGSCQGRLWEKNSRPAAPAKRDEGCLWQLCGHDGKRS